MGLFGWQGRLVALLLVCAFSGRDAGAASATRGPGQGSLLGRVGSEAPRNLPLAKTRVRAQVTGGMARVVVAQEFTNPFPESIEAIYVFPLPARAAVTGSVVRLRNRIIRGTMAPRDRAREAYLAAKAAGHRAVTVDQERPNIFTQSVSSIPAGAKIRVELEYHISLEARDGVYELGFPMVVAPRSVPGTPDGRLPSGAGRLPDTNRTPDASRITPPVLPKGLRSGRDVDIQVAIDEGAALVWVKSPSHAVAKRKVGAGRVVAKLRSRKEIPNRDFVLRYKLRPSKAPVLVVHREADGSGFIGLTLFPSQATRAPTKPGRVVYLIDDTGSMSGSSIASARQVILSSLATSSSASEFAIAPLSGAPPLGPTKVSARSRARARRYLAGISPRVVRDVVPGLRRGLAMNRASGTAGTRFVFISDGWFGNEAELARQIARARVRLFTVMVGAAPNRYLHDVLARAGRGRVLALALGEDHGAVAAALSRVLGQASTKIRVSWPGVHSMAPEQPMLHHVGELLRVFARFERLPKSTTVVVESSSARPAKWVLDLGKARSNSALPLLWARERIGELGFDATVSGADHSRVIEKLGVDFGILTPYTSFVARDESIGSTGVNKSVHVAVDLPAATHRALVLADSSIGDDLDAPEDSTTEGLETGVEAPPPPAPEPRERKRDEQDAGDAESMDIEQTGATQRLIARGPRGLLPSLSVAAGIGAADTTFAALAVDVAVSRAFGRISLGLGVSGLIPLDAEPASYVALVPRVGLRALPRLELRAFGGPGLTGDGDFAAGLGVGASVPVWRWLSLDLQAQRLFLPKGSDVDVATGGFKVSF